MDAKTIEYAEQLIKARKSGKNLRKTTMKDGGSFNQHGKPDFKPKGSSINSVSHNRGRV